MVSTSCKIDAVIEAAQFVEILLGQRHRRIGTQRRPFVAREAAERRDFLDQFFHDQSLGLEAFSAIPLTPSRFASSAMTSASLTSAASSRTSR